SRSPASTRPMVPALGALATLSGAARAIFTLLLVLTCARLALLTAEVALLPLVPTDAWAQWTGRSRIWYEYGAIVPLTPIAEAGRATAAMPFPEAHLRHPGTVPLFQDWTALWLGRWDDALVNLPWVAACAALGLACYGQLRRLEFGPLKAMF